MTHFLQYIATIVLFKSWSQLFNIFFLQLHILGVYEYYNNILVLTLSDSTQLCYKLTLIATGDI